ncbi:MAG: dienelactone hydrolase family protein [Planctomycetota bacterium]|nr:dienelactone hydrolase family protein [Planctomycetota bacterium]
MRSRPALLVPSLILGLALPLLGRGAMADVLVPKRGKAVRGAIVKQSDTEVVFNIYWSRNPGVVNPEHLQRLPMAQVKRVEAAPHPEVEIWRRVMKAKTADEFAAAGAYAKEHKLKAQAKVCFALALAQDASHAAAMKGLGGRGKWDAERKGNPQLDPELQALLERYVAEADAPARVKLQRSIKEKAFKAKPHELERWRRSIHQPKGYQRDRPLSYRSNVHKGAVYTLYVPEGYTPARMWPLMIGLHGGGPDGKNGDEVVGSGPSAMNFYQRHAAKHGYIVACPTALRAGWPNKVNEDYVRDLITELRLLYHVDIDRIYLTGHSMGGFGTWGLGPRLAEDLAAISPMAGGGGGISKLVATKTPVFIFHGADDRVVGPSSDRSLAKQLLETTHDFVYTELDGVGHGFPGSVQQELFDFFDPRRRYDKKYKAAWPRSSFAGKPSKDEVTFLGDPLAAIRGDTPDLKAWLGWLRLGGGRALAAVSALAEQKPEGAASAIGKVLTSAGVVFSGRGYAARALGALGDPSGAVALRKAVAMPAERDTAMVAIECARALVALKDAEAVPALGRALEVWTGFYESKQMDPMRYSDWRRATSVLAALAEAWATLASADSKPDLLAKTVVARVLGAQDKVQTSSRVPQDPATTRVQLARAVAEAYKRTNAPAGLWDKLLEALGNDASARAAAAALRP